MHTAKILMGCSLALSLGSTASAQIPVDVGVFALTDASGTAVASVHAERLADDVIVEHWVVTRDDSGVPLTGTLLEGTGERFGSVDEFLEAMREQASALEAEWFYARQEVVYASLAEAVEAPEEPAEPIGCTTLVDETGVIVGRQVRTGVDDELTDDWVLYPSFETSRDHGSIEFIGVPLEECQSPDAFLSEEYEAASAGREVDRYVHARATFSLVPL